MERGEWLKLFAFATSILALLFVGGTAASLATGGRNDVGLNALLGVFRAEPETFAQSIMFDIRLPRTVAVILIGMNLAITGLVLQAITRNPLASQSIFGANQGAALGMVLMRFSFTMLDAAVGVFAVASALVAGLLTLLVLLNGGCLAISGTIVQALLRNPLASPKIIGINSGAALAVYLMVIMFPNLSITYLPVAAVMGGCLEASLIYLGAEFGKVPPARLVLIGIAVGLLCDAGVNYILVTSPTFTFSTPLVWLTGSLWARGWAHVGMVWHVLPLLGVASVTLSFRLDLIRLGDAHATGLGMNVRVERFMLMVLAVLLASVSVSVVGVLGFVGLMAPQIASSLMGGEITVS